MPFFIRRGGHLVGLKLAESQDPSLYPGALPADSLLEFPPPLSFTLKPNHFWQARSLALGTGSNLCTETCAIYVYECTLYIKKNGERFVWVTYLNTSTKVKNGFNSRVVFWEVASDTMKCDCWSWAGWRSGDINLSMDSMRYAKQGSSLCGKNML